MSASSPGMTPEFAADLRVDEPSVVPASVDSLFDKIAAEYASPLARLARAHEANAALQQDLLQEIHLAIWRSLAGFNGRCSVRTWVYRVAHNVAATHLLRQKRRRLESLSTLDELALAANEPDLSTSLDEQRVLARLTHLIHSLKPVDRQLIVLHLEGIAADEIAEIAGLSVPNVHTKLHRIRELLAKRIHSGEQP
jgi:RNA polymerase sigma-70 factor (ECF subfamily)